MSIAGQSAGGGAVTTLLGMEAAQHLFHGAYCMSGAVNALPAARAQSLGRSLADRAGVSPTRAGWSAVTEERVLELQEAETSINLRTLKSMRTGGLPLGPTVDGDLIRDHRWRRCARASAATNRSWSVPPTTNSR